MNQPFSKYHGLGNDFILLDGPANLNAPQIRALCDRHQGIGADGILVREPGASADHRMRLYNADGSAAEISGNGLRCFVLFLRDRGYDVSRELTIETGGGVQRARLLENNTVETTMPLPRFGASGKAETMMLDAQGVRFAVVPVSVGNPHGVIFGPQRDIAFAETYGPALEKHPAFSAGANIEFVKVLSSDSCRLVVWERGAGITLACGSGSTATACAGAAVGHFTFDTPIAVHQPGGTLAITVTKGFEEVRQKGPATFVFTGEVNI
jgi:diaminopimelate epimerase